MEGKQFTQEKQEKKERIVLVFDVGTQSTRALLINNRGSILAKARKSMSRLMFRRIRTMRSRMRSFITASSVRQP